MVGKKTIFLSACEASGDIHCANLIKAIQVELPDAQFVGIGGPHMKEAGCKIIQNPLSRAAMGHNSFAEIGYFWKLLQRIKAYFKDNKPDMLVVCDSPSFNFHVAKAAKKFSMKTFFYVAPQLWAWAPWRIKKLRKCCDKIACILPFEQEWFNSRGMDAEFIGNPLLEDRAQQIEKSKKSFDGYEPAKAKIALMPGSRKAEINAMWPAMQEVAMMFKEVSPEIAFTTVALNDETKSKLQSSQLAGFECEYSVDSVVETSEASDFALTTSGSACLEIASAGCPMVIMYHTNKILWHLVGRWLIQTKFLSLVNILAHKELVPEFMPYFKSPRQVYETAVELAGNPEKLKQTSSDLVDLTLPLAQKNAPETAAKMIVVML